MPLFSDQNHQKAPFYAGFFYKENKMFLRILFMTFMMLSLFFNAASAAGNDPVIAKAEGYVFRESDLSRILSYSPPYLQEQLKKNPEQKEMLIKRLMHQKIISDMARKEGFDKKPEVKEQLQYVIDDFLAKEYIVQTIVEKVSVTDSELRDFYNSHKEQFTTPEQVKASHILIKVNFGATEAEKKKAKEKAEQILEWLKKGEKFETLAAQYSDDKQSKAMGGSLGYIKKGQMPKSFDEAAFSMKPGQISEVVETDFGYHIIRIEDHKDAATKTFDEVKDSILEQMKKEKAKSEVEEFIKKVEKDAGMEIHTEYLVDKKKE
jgi:parvulin-like peptidyl-prolyl isomerase